MRAFRATYVTSFLRLTSEEAALIRGACTDGLTIGAYAREAALDAAAHGARFTRTDALHPTE